MQNKKDISWIEAALYVASVLMIGFSRFSLFENLAYSAIFGVLGLNSFAIARINKSMNR